MKKSLAVLTLTSALIFPQMAFAKADTEETQRKNIGFGSGLVAGIAIGGPIGGFIGGVTGILIGNTIDVHEQLTHANSALSDSKTELAKLEQEYQQAMLLAEQKERQIEQVQLVSLQSELKEILTPVQTNIQFKTASFEVESHYKNQLDVVATSLKRHKDAQITLEGFSDRRGDASYNQQLSKQRVSAVKQFLLDKGVNEKQIVTFAFGENRPVNAKQNLENDFFDRRVALKIEKAKPVLTAANLANQN